MQLLSFSLLLKVLYLVTNIIPILSFINIRDFEFRLL